jgi:arylsulfatase A
MPDRPNIILINCDDLGYGDLGCYGSEVNSTPTLDRLAAEGMRFTDFYMAASVCSPSRAAMLTGCYPKRVGFGTYGGQSNYLKLANHCGVLFPGDPVGLNPDEVTVASLLKEQGYATKIVGKWHCGDQPEFLPTRHGFDEWFGLPYSNDQCRRDVRPNYAPLPLMRNEEVLEQQPDQAALTERYAFEGVEFLRANAERPFFLYFAHMYVHTPIYAPKRFLDASQNGPYGAAVECIDWATAVLLDELDRLGLTESTLVVFTSDNGSTTRGGASNAPLRGHKGSTWEGGMRLPCIMRWPGTIPAGVESGELVTSMDFLPTFARLAGGEPPADRIIDGLDIAAIMRAEPGAKSPREAFYYYLGDRMIAVRSGRWKYAIKDRELYDLESDIGEEHNVIADHPDVVTRLDALADEFRQDLGDSLRDIEGSGCRPIGRIENPDTLTHYDPDHPYIIAMYD